METKLTALMEYQKFEPNADLQRVIDAVHARYATRELSLDEMDLIAAAGTPEDPSGRKKPEKGRK